MVFHRGKLGQLVPCLLMLALFAQPVCADEAVPSPECDNASVQQPDEVKISIPEIVVDEYRNTAQDLAVMTGLHNDLNSQLGGITTGQPLVAYEIDPNLSLLPSRAGVCARPSLKLTVGYSSLNVYMNIDIPRNSCIYNSIFSHEMHHVDIYKHYLSRNIEQIRKSVADKFNGRSYRFNSIFEAKQYIEILGQVFSQHLQEQFMHEVYAEQAGLDTQTEYSRIQLECAQAGHGL